jgi:hypothetical protein
MKNLVKLLIPIVVVTAMSGCVVAPYGYHRGYYGRAYYGYGPRVVVAPAPVVVVRP